MAARSGQSVVRHSAQIDNSIRCVSVRPRKAKTGLSDVCLLAPAEPGWTQGKARRGKSDTRWVRSSLRRLTHQCSARQTNVVGSGWKPRRSPYPYRTRCVVGRFGGQGR
ncbi:hypothetical protein CGCA056_v001068 [Colletotrichum aenigma]|uniref:uncharacterized protein n=1 Tax=Colletotrichum aenigma TaxID=1215731 RepID=UPI0018728B93|nr:uncharacterized protein CGCA056_v001068 [Colletotrichum aenigma]KAF5528364.1 hypothetical protein CGCA056_v001068 [Colletotrichum aenigma]